MERRRVPVPPVEPNAVEVSAREYVVVIFEPPVTVGATLTRTTMFAMAVAPTESVTVMVS